MPARLRLVHAMAVDYSDTATSNNLALDQLTGVDSIRKVLVPPDPAFAALRAARDTYGADLVQLVRKFQTPEQKSCGVAWLNGGGGTTIDPQNEFYGYSVIADGTDRDEGDGKNYFCRNETSVHEFGHNMGSAHDRATGGTTGAYPYSNGYKTDAANGNFYTVMAYGDSGQTAYRIFSNPASTYCGGFACGVAEQSDNARSLRQTIPLIAQFRATKVAEPARARVRSDFNGDGKSDILWRNSVDGRNSLWLMGGATPASIAVVYLERDQDWKVVGIGDFNGDGRADAFWRNATTGRNFIQFMDGFATLPGSGHTQALSDAGWALAAVADFNGDGRDDLSWRNRLSGQNALWTMSGLVVQGQTAVYREPDAAWRVLGAGDFNGDGKADVFWRNAWHGGCLLYTSPSSRD